MKDIKTLARTLGLARPAKAVFNAYARCVPRHICTRRGIRYEVDLSELIDRAIYLGGWEPGAVAFFEQTIRADDVVVEVGANIGAHTLILADLVGPQGRVIAFEPTSYAQRKLRRNLSLNPHLASRVIVRTEPVSNHELATPVLTIKSSFPIGTRKAADETLSTAPIALDNERFNRVDILKVDVDGYDVKVLEGAQGLLAKHKPLVMIELCEYALKTQGNSVRDIFILLTSMGYQAFREDGRAIRDADEVLNEISVHLSINGVFRHSSRDQPI